MTLEGPECWIIRKIGTTQLPTNFTEIHLVKKVFMWGLALRKTLEDIVSGLKTLEDREDATIPWSRFTIQVDD